MITTFEQIIAAVRSGNRTIAIAAAADGHVLKAAAEIEAFGIAKFIYLGAKRGIVDIAERSALTVDQSRIVDIPDVIEATRAAVALVRDGGADLVMKGLVQTADFLRAVLDKEMGLRGKNLLNQISVCEKPDGEGLLFISDCAMNVAPGLNEKRQIIENTVDMAHRLGIDRPKVAVLSAVEVVNPDMPETIEAAALSKMAERGQIKGAIVDGPLALDNAVSVEAARHKGIDTPVAGRADILIMPNLNAGNVLHKSIIHFSKLKVASVLMGARIPVIATSRTDSEETKFLSIALAAYLSANSSR